jgi:AraC-like DNA-binding protein
MPVKFHSIPMPNTYLRQFFRFLGSHEDFLNNTSETFATLSKLGGGNSFKDYCQFFRNAKAVLDNPAIGLKLGQVNQLSNMHGPLSTAIYNCETLYECFELMYHYVSLRVPFITLQWLEDNERVGLRIIFKEKIDDIHPSLTETLMHAMTSIVSMMSRNENNLGTLELDYCAPEYVQDYYQAFPVSIISFEQPNIQFYIPKTMCHYRTVTEPDPIIKKTAIARCEELLKGAVTCMTTSEKTLQLFAENPGKIWSQVDISRQLNISTRTLQRRLKDEGPSYQELQKRWLMNEAKELLSDNRLAVESVGLLLGYSDVSSFRRAVRQWYGVSPQALRIQIKN